MRLVLAVIVASICRAAFPEGAHLEITGLPPRLWGGGEATAAMRVAGVEEVTDLHLAWALTFRSQQVLGGEVLSLTEQMLGGCTVRIDLPPVRGRMPMMLNAEVRRGATLLTSKSVSMELFPSDLLTGPMKWIGQRRVGLVADAHTAERLRQAVPVGWQRLASSVEVRAFAGDLVIMQAGSDLTARADLLCALLARVEQGMNLALLGWETVVRDEGAPPARAPLKVKALRVLAREHPLMANLEPGDLRGWGHDGVVGQALDRAPAGGNCVPILDVPNEQAPTLAAVEVRHGDGRILLCGLAVMEKLGEEPIAQIVLGNLLRWGFSERGASYTDPAVFLRRGSHMQRVLTKLGARVGPGAAEHEGVLMGDETLLDDKHWPLTQRRLASGGTVLLFHLSERGVERLNNLSRAVWERDTGGPVPSFAVQVGGADSLEAAVPGATGLLAGSRPEDLRMLALAGNAQAATRVVAVADREHFSALLGQGVVGKLERGRARLLLWQAPVNDDDAVAERVLSVLLTNIGVRMTLDTKSLPIS